MKKLLSIGIIMFLCACTTIIESDKTKLLMVSSKMDKSIFLIPVTPMQRTIFIDIKNFSEYDFFDLSESINNGIIAKGYKVVKDPSDAHFMLQTSTTKVEENKKEALNNYKITTDLKISQRVTEGIYLRKLQRTQKSKDDFSELSFNNDKFEMTETMASDNKTSLYWRTYQTEIKTITNDTELSFNDITNTLVTKLSDIIVNIF